MSNVFIAFQRNEETRCIVDAIVADNPSAIVNMQPAMVKVDVANEMVIRRSSVEEQIGRPFDLQELHINLITLTGHITETDEEFTLSWKH